MFSMTRRTLNVRRLGRLEYGAAYRLQKETEAEVRERRAPDGQHVRVLDQKQRVGRRAARDGGGILASAEELDERGVSVFETNRGGKMTYHGLGQLVGYPVVNLSPEREDVHKYVRDLEEVLIRAVGDFGVRAFRIEGLTGVHTERGKVAAIGVHIARWVTTHGFALNVNTDLSFFNLIIACEGEPVTSLQELLGREILLGEVEDAVVARFREVFGMTVEMTGDETSAAEETAGLVGVAPAPR